MRPGAKAEIEREKKNSEYAFYAVMLFLAFLFMLATQLRNDFTNPDGIGYYAHLRSAALDRDLFYLNEFDRLKLAPYFYDPSPTGYVQNQWPIGNAVLWSPFFLAAQTLEKAASAFGANVPTGGYSPFDALAIVFATAFYGFLALWFCMKTARRLDYPSWAAFAAAIFIWVGTPLFYYQFYESAMAHTTSAFAASLLVFLWQRDKYSRGTVDWLLLGAAAGLAALVRTELAILAILPASDLLRRDPDLTPGNRIVHAAAFGAAALVVFLPQLIVWKIINGGFLASYQGAANFIWSNPHPLETLFSDYHGLFVWAPVVALAVLGWLLSARDDSLGTVATFIVFSVFTFAVSCLIWWWGSGAFGARFFVGLTPLFFIGLTAFLSKWKHPGIPAAIAAVCAAWTFLLMLQVTSGKLFLVKYYPLKELAANSMSIISTPSAALKMFFTPKIAGLQLAPVIAGVIFAASLLFILIVTFARRITTAAAVAVILPLAVLLSAFVVFCGANGKTAVAAGAPQMSRIAAHPLEELYETFPLQYADYYLKKNNPEKALRELKRLERLVPDNQAVPISEAGVLLSIGNKADAAKALARATPAKFRHPLTARTYSAISKALHR